MPTIAITDYTFPDLSLEEAVLREAGLITALAELLKAMTKGGRA